MICAFFCLFVCLFVWQVTLLTSPGICQRVVLLCSAFDVVHM